MRFPTLIAVALALSACATTPKPVCPDVAALTAGATDAEILGARYVQRVNVRGEAAVEREWHYWRKPHLVAYEYPDNGISEVWYRTPNGRISLERRFDDYGRSIQYEPADLSMMSRADQWGELRATVVLDEFEPEAVSACAGTQTFVRKRDEAESVVQWLPGLHLPASITTVRDGRRTETELLSVTTAADAERFFAVGLEYDSMDYADIGDNEADPFIRQMIRLGFVEHDDH